VILLSLLLVLVSLGLLIAGLAGASRGQVWASILSSLVAGMFLAFAVLRQRAPAAEDEDATGGVQPTPWTGPTGAGTAQDEAWTEPGGPRAGPSPDDLAAVTTVANAAGPPDEDYPDPPDEPPEENVSAPDALRVIDLAADVLVVDGRPRYHLRDCSHLAGRESIPLPIPEARESGFTPCSLCRPSSRLAQQARASTAPRWTGPEGPPGGPPDPGRGPSSR
jgi:hypothetical protein